MSSFDLYQSVTDQIVAMLETDVVPWRSPILGLSKAGYLAEEPARLEHAFEVLIETYAEAFGRDAGDAFKKAIIAWRAGIPVIGEGTDAPQSNRGLRMERGFAPVLLEITSNSGENSVSASQGRRTSPSEHQEHER